MASNGTLWAIDPYPKGSLNFNMQMLIASREVAKISNGSVEWIRKTGTEAGSDFAASKPTSFDFVFIDGDHSYQGLRGDWECWSPLIAPNGILALHDSRPTIARPIAGAGSVRFTREVILSDSRFEVIDAIDSLTVLRRAQQ